MLFARKDHVNGDAASQFRAPKETCGIWPRTVLTSHHAALRQRSLFENSLEWPVRPRFDSPGRRPGWRYIGLIKPCKGALTMIVYYLHCARLWLKAGLRPARLAASSARNTPEFRTQNVGPQPIGQNSNYCHATRCARQRKDARRKTPPAPQFMTFRPEHASPNGQKSLVPTAATDD